MRVINFRAWDPASKVMYPVEAINLCGCKTVTVQYNPVKKFLLDNIRLMQHTGVQSANGTGIYEGDILTDNDEDYLVDFCEGEFVAVADGFMCPLSEIADQVIVVGNRWEDPEIVPTCINEFASKMIRGWT